jgi:hypothetical protein
MAIWQAVLCRRLQQAKCRHEQRVAGPRHRHYSWLTFSEVLLGMMVM